MAVLALNAIDQMFFIPGYPFWSLMIIALDVVAMWGLCAYGSRQNLAAVSRAGSVHQRAKPGTGDVEMRFRRRKVSAVGRAADGQAGWSGPPRLAERSCCCPARPVVRVLIPPGPDHPRSVDLLLCGHHYLASQAALAVIGAAVMDVTGTVVELVPAGCQRSRA